MSRVTIPQPKSIWLEFDPGALPAIVDFFTAVTDKEPSNPTGTPTEATPGRDASISSTPAASSRKAMIRRLRNHPKFLGSGIARGLVEVLAERPGQWLGRDVGEARAEERGYSGSTYNWDMRHYFTASVESGGLYDRESDGCTLINYATGPHGEPLRMMTPEDAALWRDLDEEEKEANS